MFGRSPRVVGIALVALVATGQGVFGDAAPAPSHRDGAYLAKECEYGITRAFANEMAQAESAFVSLLSNSSGDARALNNLGNIHFLRGDPEVALAFYDWAMRSDTADGGIRLNRATTYMMLGQQERAKSEAAAGVLLAGGPDKAGALVGIKSDGTVLTRGTDSSSRVAFHWTAPRKPGQKSHISSDEIRSLISSGSPGVTAAAKTADAKVDPAAGKISDNRSKASGEENAAGLLYWKR